MVKCEYCGKEVALPFRCKYCGGIFCVEHHLPENHECPALKEKKVMSPAFLPKYSLTYEPRFEEPIKVRKISLGFKFYPGEIRDLIIATVAVFLAFATLRLPLTPYRAITILFVVITCYIVHELAHKFSAQYYGYFARFTLEPFGLALTLITSIIPFGIKVIMPGDVRIGVFTGFPDVKKVGVIAAAGPISNLVIFFIAKVLENLGFGLFADVAMINAWVSFFNLIPIGVLDGLKILKWNIGVWALLFILAFAATFLI